MKLKSPAPRSRGSSDFEGPCPSARVAPSTTDRTARFPGDGGMLGNSGSKRIRADVRGSPFATISSIRARARPSSSGVRKRRSPRTTAARATTFVFPAARPEVPAASGDTSVPARASAGLTVTDRCPANARRNSSRIRAAS